LQTDQKRPNILILLFDTTSAPHLSIYGYPRQNTPNLQRFAEQATVYHTHYSGGSFTTPGTASILTGLFPWNHRAINIGGSVRRNRVSQNLFAVAGDGYFRIGYSQNPFADIFLRQFNSSIDLHLPASKFAFSNPLLSDKATNDTLPFYAMDDFLIGRLMADKAAGSVTLGLLDIALGRGKHTNPDLSKLNMKEVPFNGYFYYQNHTVFNGIYETVREVAMRNQPYLGYFHLFSPHGPYAPTKDFTSLFRDNLKVPRKPLHPLIPKKEMISDKYLDHYSQAYDQFIANVDAEFGYLLDQLVASGLLENTYVIVLSDHGQLFERGVHGHASHLLYDQGIHVPLIISAPGQTERQDVHLPTSNVDILPTIAALTGGQLPEGLDGAILPGFGSAPLIGGAERSIYCVEAKESSAFHPLVRGSFVMVRGSHKMIWYSGYQAAGDIVELYNLEADPLELHDLSKDEPEVTKEMLEELTLMRKKADAPFTAGAQEKNMDTAGT
jgi:arylsulfatase A-like enzyme